MNAWMKKREEKDTLCDDAFFSFFFFFFMWVLFLACVAAVVLGGQLREYNFSVRASVWAPDGFPRPVLSYWPSPGTHHGRAEQPGTPPFPGPLIRLRVNDTLRVTVSNHLHSESASVHWHGLHNLWQDGVPGVTECGIAPFEQRVYEFVVRQSGTYWYHSHTGGQYHDGLLGPIVIDPQEDEAALYGYNQGEDYVAMMQDWVIFFVFFFLFFTLSLYSIMRLGAT